jgi:hypothetical protein
MFKAHGKIKPDGLVFWTVSGHGWTRGFVLTTNAFACRMLADSYLTPDAYVLREAKSWQRSTCGTCQTSSTSA